MSLPSSRQAPIQSVKGASGSLTAYDSRRAIPGDSPAYCVGDPSQKITLRSSNLTSEIGLKPRIKLTVSLNGIVGPRVESDLCSQLKVDIMQHSKCVCPPKQGLVDISYSIVIPYWWLKKGNYTLHVEMYATDGGRMTDFEGTTWRNGEAGESDGWFRIEKWKGNG